MDAVGPRRSCSAATGDKFFCAGADIKMLTEADPAFKYYFCLHANETLNRLEQTPKVVIAALNGHCVGGGLGDRARGRPARREAGRRQDRPSRGRPRRAARHRRHAAAGARCSGARAAFELDGDRPHVLVRGGSDARPGPRGLSSAATFDAQGRGVRARSSCPPSRRRRRSGSSSARVVSGLEAGFAEGLALERELQQRSVRVRGREARGWPPTSRGALRSSRGGEPRGFAACAGSVRGRTVSA